MKLCNAPRPVSHWGRPLVISLAGHILLGLVVAGLPAPVERCLPSCFVLEPTFSGGGRDVHYLDIVEDTARDRVMLAAGEGVDYRPTVEGKPPSTWAAAQSELPLPSGEGGGLRGQGSGNPSSSLFSKGAEGAKGLFAVPTGVRSVVYVIDRSGSMGEMGRLPLARRELAASLQGLPDSVGFQVIVYNRRAVTLPMAGRAGLVPATAGNVARALQFLESLVPEGGTAHREALKQALKLQPEVLFFLTDADDLKPEDVMVLTGMNRGKTAIHVVELGPGHRNPEALPMHRLARSNGGTYRAVDVSH